MRLICTWWYVLWEGLSGKRRWSEIGVTRCSWRKRSSGRVWWERLIWTRALNGASGRGTARRWKAVGEVRRVGPVVDARRWERWAGRRTVRIEANWCRRPWRRWWMRVVRRRARCRRTPAGGASLRGEWTSGSWNTSARWVASSSPALNRIRETREC